jgi:hypothetical protein
MPSTRHSPGLPAFGMRCCPERIDQIIHCIFRGKLPLGIESARFRRSQTKPPVVPWLARGPVLALVALVVGAGPPKAAEIDFGALTPSPGGSAHTVAADKGLVCNNGETFTANGSTFVATGYSNAFTTATALSWKPENPPVTTSPNNPFNESGLGENATGAGTACTDTSAATDCEITGRASVAIVSNHPITDVIIGSVQTGENFQVYTGSSISNLTKFGGAAGSAGRSAIRREYSVIAAPYFCCFEYTDARAEWTA